MVITRKASYQPSESALVLSDSAPVLILRWFFMWSASLEPSSTKLPLRTAKRLGYCSMFNIEHRLLPRLASIELG
jgi:hypothetical protein